MPLIFLVLAASGVAVRYGVHGHVHGLHIESVALIAIVMGVAGALVSVWPGRLAGLGALLIGAGAVARYGLTPAVKAIDGDKTGTVLLLAGATVIVLSVVRALARPSGSARAHADDEHRLAAAGRWRRSVVNPANPFGWDSPSNPNSFTNRAHRQFENQRKQFHRHQQHNRPHRH
jgi:hypothetical protein